MNRRLLLRGVATATACSALAIASIGSAAHAAERTPTPASHVASFFPFPLPSPSLPVSSVEAAALGRSAYIYGLPIMEFLRVREQMTNTTCWDTRGNAPINVLSKTRNFARPSSDTVVAPNVDTLYTIAQVDLGDGPVVLAHPDMGDRYFVFQLVDPYTNTVGYVGSRTTGSGAGRFAITWSGAPGSTHPGVKELPEIKVESQRIWVIGRTLVRQPKDNTEDLEAARALMEGYTLTPPGGAPAVDECPPDAPEPPDVENPTGLDFLEKLNTALKDNPPPAADAPILKKLARIGVGPGLSPRQAGLSRRVLNTLDRSVKRIATTWPRLVQLGQEAGSMRSGWSDPPGQIGDYGTDYELRAAVAQAGLGANTRDEAMYLSTLADSRKRRLDGRNSYRLRFPPGKTPPNNAFWSVTVYDTNGRLVDHPVGTGWHAVGDTHPPLITRSDGSVDIVFSYLRPFDPTVNWLPIPRGRFSVYMRIYVPTQEVLDRTWMAPPIERLARPRFWPF